MQRVILALITLEIVCRHLACLGPVRLQYANIYIRMIVVQPYAKYYHSAARSTLGPISSLA